MRTRGLLYINGTRHEIEPDHAGMMLADWLRQVVGLPGTKIVCAEGDCGACTVLRHFPAFKSTRKQASEFLSVNSCILTVGQLDGSSLVTVDAIGGDALTPVQSAMMKCHGSQCGFCTPGFVMALSGLVEKKLIGGSVDAKISEKEARNATTGNLCRCTGYQPILEAATSIEISKCESVTERFYSRAQERELKAAVKESLLLERDDFSFFAPTSLKEAVKYLKKNPEARLLAAATDMGVFHNKWRKRLDCVLSLHLVPDLYAIKSSKGRMHVGARATLTELRDEVKDKVPELARFLDLFASPQIKNVATLVGNVANASPIADTPPFLLVSDAIVETFGPKGEREIPIDEFFLDYRKTALLPGELITAISFALPRADETLAIRKVSERKDLDISSVNAAFRISWSGEKIKTARIAYGGVAATAVRLKKTEALLEGRELDANSLELALRTMQSEITPISDVRGTAAFRRVLAENLMRSFLNEARA